MDLWAYQRGVTLDFSRPGKPTDNAFIEAFNSKLRSECANTHWFLSLEDACKKLDRWRRHYNEERPHSAIRNIPPIMLANPAGATSPPDPGQAENSRPERSKVGSQCTRRKTLAKGDPRLGSSAPRTFADLEETHERRYTTHRKQSTDPTSAPSYRLRLIRKCGMDLPHTGRGFPRKSVRRKPSWLVWLPIHLPILAPVRFTKNNMEITTQRNRRITAYMANDTSEEEASY